MESTIAGKKILLGVTGSIAAYKSAFLTRLLIKAGAQVRIVMTQAATHFLPPVTLATLSRHEVLIDLTDNQTQSWNNHVQLGLWADVFLVAPASAHTIAKFAHGLCDNLLTATYLSVRCPVVIAPAMDEDMWHHPATQANIQKLQSFGHHIIDVGHGELASGLIGAGRMAEPETIMAHLERLFQKKKVKAAWLT